MTTPQYFLEMAERLGFTVEAYNTNEARGDVAAPDSWTLVLSRQTTPGNIDELDRSRNEANELLQLIPVRTGDAFMTVNNQGGLDDGDAEVQLMGVDELFARQVRQDQPKVAPATIAPWGVRPS
jgi:hypothetical protein